MDVLKRVVRQSTADHVTLISAGVAFYAFLALFPALVALISLYGLFTDPAEVEENMQVLLGILPQAAHDMLAEQLRQLTSSADQTLGITAGVGVLLALWSANKGTKALFEGLNIAYDETNSRGFFMENALTLLFTVCIALIGIASLLLIAAFGLFVQSVGWPVWVESVLGIVRWLLLAAVALIVLALIYRYAPVRDAPKLRWVSAGSIFALTLWLLGSIGFSWYVSNFGSYSETYGSLAAVVIFLLWLFLCAYVVLVGGEINSELEHQTVRDTTEGPEQPIGSRGAWHADHVARVSD